MSQDRPLGRRNGKVMAMLVTLVVLTAVPAVVEGLWSRRWNDAGDIARAARELEAFPNQFGDWKEQGEEEKLPDEAVRELQCAGYFNRRYVNQKLGRDVTVMLMVGPSGPLIRHPPEICYGNRANKLLQNPQLVDVTSPDQRIHTLRLLRYKNPGASSGEFSVCYGWSEDGVWTVPEYPRLRFGGAPVLYKLQVLTGDKIPSDGKLPVATARFLDDFLPLLRDSLAPGGGVRPASAQ